MCIRDRDTVERSELLYNLDRIEKFFSQLWVKILLLVLVLLILVLVLRLTLFGRRGRRSYGGRGRSGYHGRRRR